MSKHYRDYYWKDGRPYGTGIVNASETFQSYKIISDPYLKRFSVEKYLFNQFDKIIYDSYLLNFRYLTAQDQQAWEREVIKDQGNERLCLLRDQDDRAVLIEHLTFENDLCRLCKISSIHGIPLCTHRMFYKIFHDVINGVVLFDAEERPVMYKNYEVDPLTREFTNLISEEWNLHQIPNFIQSCRK